MSFFLYISNLTIFLTPPPFLDNVINLKVFLEVVPYKVDADLTMDMVDKVGNGIFWINLIIYKEREELRNRFIIEWRVVFWLIDRF